MEQLDLTAAANFFQHAACWQAPIWIPTWNINIRWSRRSLSLLFVCFFCDHILDLREICWHLKSYRRYNQQHAAIDLLSNNEKNSGCRKKLLAMLDKFNCSSLSNFNFAREREFWFSIPRHLIGRFWILSEIATKSESSQRAAMAAGLCHLSNALMERGPGSSGGYAEECLSW